MRVAKRRNEQHRIDSDGAALLYERLPKYCVLRPYRPDYGIDFSLELFHRTETQSGSKQGSETLGEHILVQLKSVRTAHVAPFQIHERFNVEKRKELLDKTAPLAELVTARISVEDSELVTIERMGVGQPVLLAIADLSARRCYFVCLNDYIDRILATREEDFAARKSCTIHVPIANELGDENLGRVALRWYAKRSKLYSAFQRLSFQHRELTELREDPSFHQVARHFASRILSYDLWDDTEMWPAVGIYAAALRHLLKTGKPGHIRLDKAPPNARGWPGASKEEHRRKEILRLWTLLSLLATQYEDTCREWFLPTAVGYLSSYSGEDHSGTLAGNLGVVSTPSMRRHAQRRAGSRSRPRSS